MTCDEIQREDYELYVFGTLERGERAEIEAHLARRCPTCTARVTQARVLAVQLGLTAAPAEPPAPLRADLLKAISRPPVAEPSFRKAVWKWAFALSAAVAMALLVISAGMYREARLLERELEDLQLRAASQRERQRQLIERLDAYRQAFRNLNAPETREIRFGPGQPYGRIFLHPRGVIMIASNFPQPPPGRAYELWLIAANRPAPLPAGVFAPDAGGNAFHLWQQPVEMATVKAFAVSDEPPGGVPSPTGKIILTVPMK